MIACLCTRSVEPKVLREGFESSYNLGVATDESAIAKPVRYPLFDVLRLFLALEVVFGHVLKLPSGESLLNPIPAVACFVCLSGFLIPGSFTNSRNWGHFAWKRLLRVMPGFLVSFTLVAALWGPRMVVPTFVFYLYMGLGPQLSANPVLWSLMLEEVMYFFHGLARVTRRVWNIYTVILVFIALSALWLTLNYYDVDMPFGSGRVIPPITSFLAGNILSFGKEWMKRIHWAPIAGALALTLAARTMFEIPWEVATPLTCALTVALAFRLPQIPWDIPDYSFGVYVYHYPIFLLTRALWPTVASSLCLAALSWHLLESKALTLKDWQPRRGHREPIADAV